MISYFFEVCKKNISKSNKAKHLKTNRHNKNIKIKSGSDRQSLAGGDRRSLTGGDLQQNSAKLYYSENINAGQDIDGRNKFSYEDLNLLTGPEGPNVEHTE